MFWISIFKVLPAIIPTRAKNLFQMANHTLSMHNIDDDKPVALSVKNIERDTFATDEEPKNTAKGNEKGL